MVLVMHAVRVCKVGAGAAQFSCPGVHPRDKGVHRAGEVLREDIGRLVGRGQQQAVEQVLQAHGLSDLDILRGRVRGDAAPGLAAGGNLVVERHIAPVHRL